MVRKIGVAGRGGDKPVPGKPSRTPGTRLPIRDRERLILVSQPGDDGVVNKHGYLHLPARCRRAIGISTDNRVLLAADITRNCFALSPRTY
ncbi:hypothetical protein AB0B25_09170 [Nocardia sp. NPDC049190]|uniref:hypothetical protein n=1 Tax=Nocardia sp. NPDC049190 TaxID=3155650 RepID=UPI0033EA8197